MRRERGWRRAVRRAGTAAWMLTAAASTGCFAYGRLEGERTGRVEAAPAAVWPERDAAVLRPFLEATEELVLAFTLAPGVEVEELTDREVGELATPAARVSFAEFVGAGLLRVFERPGLDSHDGRLNFWDALVTGFEPNATFLTSRETDSDWFGDVVARAEGRPTVSPVAHLRPAEKGRLRRSDWMARTGLLEGVEMRMPRPDAPTPPRGLIVHLTAMYGVPYEHEVLDALRARGWAVVDIRTVSRVRPPRTEAQRRRIAELERRIDEVQRREVERTAAAGTALELSGELRELWGELGAARRRWFAVDATSDPEEVGRTIARAVDEVAAENAYAAEAALAYLKRERPGLADGPIVVMGFSAGALAAPAVATKLGEAVDAVVLIGGGANVFEIARGSAFTDGGLRIGEGEEPVPPATMRAIGRAYLKHSKLDPYHVAPRLRDVPVLQVHAAWDAFVPARTGELLWRRLGRPDRAVFWGGHRGLFYFLPSQSRRIARWLEERVPSATAARLARSGRGTEGESGAAEPNGAGAVE